MTSMPASSISRSRRWWSNGIFKPLVGCALTFMV